MHIVVVSVVCGIGYGIFTFSDGRKWLPVADGFFVVETRTGPRGLWPGKATQGQVHGSLIFAHCGRDDVFPAMISNPTHFG